MKAGGQKSCMHLSPFYCIQNPGWVWVRVRVSMSSWGSTPTGARVQQWMARLMCDRAGTAGLGKDRQGDTAWGRGWLRDDGEGLWGEPRARLGRQSRAGQGEGWRLRELQAGQEQQRAGIAAVPGSWAAKASCPRSPASISARCSHRRLSELIWGLCACILSGMSSISIHPSHFKTSRLQSVSPWLGSGESRRRTHHEHHRRISIRKQSEVCKVRIKDALQNL